MVELEGLLVILQAQLLGAAVESGQLVVRLLEDEGGGGVVGLGLAGGLGDLFEVFEPDGDLEPTELAAERQIFLRLFRLLFQLLAGFLNLHMGQIPVFLPVKSNVTHAALIDVKLGKAAVFQLGAFQMFFTFFDITPGIIHTPLGNYLEGSVLLFTKLLILFQHRRFKLQMKLAFFLIFLFS